MRQAAAISVTDPKAGELLWEQADRMITDGAYSVPLLQMRWVDLVSSRLGNYTFSEISRVIFSKVWVR
jgi:peptide/nickel transport system substrate-binding protein